MTLANPSAATKTAIARNVTTRRITCSPVIRHRGCRGHSHPGIQSLEIQDSVSFTHLTEVRVLLLVRVPQVGPVIIAPQVIRGRDAGVHTYVQRSVIAMTCKNRLA